MHIHADTFLYARQSDVVVYGWVWRCTQTRECVCLLVGEGEGVGMENPHLD